MSKIRFSVVLFLLSTLLLKFSSMFRDLVISGYYGASYKADAYFASMTIPNAIILFMLTGMKDAFLPSYFKYDKMGKGFSHLTNIVKGTFIFSVLIAIVGTVASPFLVKWLYPEFSKYADGYNVAVWTIGFYFLSILLVGVNAVYEGYFDSKQKFSFSTFSQTIVVLATLVFAFVLHRSMGIYSVPIGYFVGTVLSFLLKVIVLSPQKMINWRQKPEWKEIKVFYQIFWPVGVTIAVGQINLSVNMLFASRMGEGVVSNLNYAFRLVSIPQNVFGVTIATIIYPILARAKTEKNQQMFKMGMERGLSAMLLLLAPTVCGMIYLIEPIIRTVYQRGAFTESTTLITSHYAVFYIGSVLFYSIQAVIAKGFYTLEKGHYIMRIGLLSIVFNVISNYILSKLMGPSGLALSASLVGLFYSVSTFTTLYKISGGFSLRSIGIEFSKIIMATIIMMLSLLSLDSFFHITKQGDSVTILLNTVIGGAIYIAGLLLLRSAIFRELLKKGNKKFEKNV
ncbi:murein biosynthesis integral membrane protein MurJ [Bacillus sp. EB600]|uniref:murein biosynthesis integral membrane protein MurJ n=1 Tax=Bacillus sp. EB600 TaxID=2806345 RepID=UPI00210B0B96|nr:lipid II flippase MurJ [Bacillus sp. EB600]MCQ6278660.1 oligosaccharide flippase family protein [Bacillus sp. EB600]